METVPRVKQNAFLKAGIFNNRPELKRMLADNTGGNYVSLPMVGLIGGDALNYDGNTNITTTSIDTRANKNAIPKYKVRKKLIKSEICKLFHCQIIIDVLQFM